MIDLIFNVLETVPAELADYNVLKQYHYQTDSVNPHAGIYKIRAKYPYSKDFPDPIAVIVYKMPIPQVRGRNVATNGFFLRPRSQSAQMILVNKHIRYIARLITDPRFRNNGIGEKLIRDSIKYQTVSMLETMTPRSIGNHVFSKAGFKTIVNRSPVTSRHLLHLLRTVGITEQSFDCSMIVHKRISLLTGKKAIAIENGIRKFLSPYRHRNVQQPSQTRTNYVIRKLIHPNYYFYKMINKTPFSSKK